MTPGRATPVVTAGLSTPGLCPVPVVVAMSATPGAGRGALVALRRSLLARIALDRERAAV
jgi:hypothetical protein